MPHPIRRILIAVKELDSGEFAAGRRPHSSPERLNAELCLFHALTGPLYLEVVALSKQPVTQAEEGTLAEVKGRLKNGGAFTDRGSESDHCGGVGLPLARCCNTGGAAARARTWSWLTVPGTAIRPRGFFTSPIGSCCANAPYPFCSSRIMQLYQRAPVLAALDPDHAAINRQTWT